MASCLSLGVTPGHAPLLSDEIRFGDRVLPGPTKADVFAAATMLGLEYVIDPFVPIDRWLDDFVPGDVS